MSLMPNVIEVTHPDGSYESISYDPRLDDSYLYAMQSALSCIDPMQKHDAIENLRRHAVAWGIARRKLLGDEWRLNGKPKKPRAIGRPRIFAEGSMRTGSVRLPESDWQLLREIGDGNASEGVRRLLREKQQTVAGNGLA